MSGTALAGSDSGMNGPATDDMQVDNMSSSNSSDSEDDDIVNNVHDSPLSAAPLLTAVTSPSGSVGMLVSNSSPGVRVPFEAEYSLAMTPVSDNSSRSSYNSTSTSRGYSASVTMPR
jgi:hypothetical protein